MDTHHNYNLASQKVPPKKLKNMTMTDECKWAEKHVLDYVEAKVSKLTCTHTTTLPTSSNNHQSTMPHPMHQERPRTPSTLSTTNATTTPTTTTPAHPHAQNHHPTTQQHHHK